MKNNFKDGQRTDGIKFVIGELSTNDLVEVESLKRKKVANSEQSPIIYLPYVLLAVGILMALNLLTASGLNLRMLGLTLHSAPLLTKFVSLGRLASKALSLNTCTATMCGACFFIS